MKPVFRPVCLAGALGMAVATGQAQAAATILLWPIDPWLAADANATELWIQNQGNSATTMQVRIVRWKQEDGHERYAAQQDVVASPPIVTIGTGSKQLIRLIKQAPFPQASNRPTALSWMKFLSLMPKQNPPSASSCRCVTPFRCLCMARGSRQ